MFHLRDLHELRRKLKGHYVTVTEEEIKEIKITSIREAFGNSEVSTILVPKPDANKITNKRTIKVGLVSCGIRERIDTQCL